MPGRQLKTSNSSRTRETPKPDVLLAGRRLEPGPDLHARTALLLAAPRPLAPALGIPAAGAKAQVQLLGARMLQDLAQRAGEMLEVLLAVGGAGHVAAEGEGGEERGRGQGRQVEAFMVVGRVGGGRDAGDEEEQEQEHADDKAMQ